MSVTDYFSKNVNRRIQFIFDTIAPLYGKFHRGLMKEYGRSTNALAGLIPLENKKVLDFGTGTGAWAASFLSHSPASVTGIDLSEKMLHQARQKHPDIHFIHGNIENLPDIPSGSFDLVTASFVLHGVTGDRRTLILNEMFRIADEYVVLQDFIGPTPFFIRVLEQFEKSDYKNFKKHIQTELNPYTDHLRVIPFRLGVGLYICKKK